MSKKEQFKLFASLHPELVSFIKRGETTWQDLYEIYDIYGEEENAWKNFFNKKETNEYNFKSLTDKIKNIDLKSIQEHIGTAQKALGIVEELTSKGTNITDVAQSVTNPRPINKIFED